MKNLKIITENILKMKKQISALVATGMMLTAGSVIARAEGNKVTAQDVVNAMLTGNKIEAEITEEEAERLVRKAEEAIEKAGSNLLPYEITEKYEKSKEEKGKEKIKTLGMLAVYCDTLLYDGTAKMMTYPEAIQFENVCEDVCGQLIKKGNTAIYSAIQTEMYGEDTYTNLEEIVKQAKENRETKKDTYVIALGTDLGFYDECFDIPENEPKQPEEEINPPTGIDMTTSVGTLALGSATVLGMLASRKKKEEKGKVYTKRK